MDKKGQVIVILIIVILIVASIIVWQISERMNKEKTTTETPPATTGNASTTQQIDCSQLNLIIERVDCLENLTEITVSVSRGEDSLGEGELTVYATDKNEIAKSAKHLNFTSSSTSNLTIKSLVTGINTKITVEFEITKDGKKSFCPGPSKEYNCQEGTEASPIGPESSSDVPNPLGKLRGVDQRDDEDGGYFCNYTEKPEHAVRLYTYKDINKERILSESYIESNKIDNACESYSDITNESVGMKYNMKWSWDAVEGIDGYRLYQYYSYNDTKIDYDYYIDRPLTYTEFTDSGFNLWRS